MTIHQYSIYGLQIASELRLAELLPGEGPTDVVIRRGRVPNELPDAKKRGVLYEAAPGRLRLAIRGIARYLVSDGKEIVVEVEPEADEADVRVFLFGSAMGALLLQRGILPLHASAIEYDGGCVVFAGPSGHGKSTLAAAFHREGYRVLADDVLAVTVANGEAPQAYAAEPELKLWGDALEELDIDPDGLPKVRPGIEKSRLPTGQAADGGSLPISHVYVLANTNEDRLELTPIEGMEKLGVLTRHTYRSHFLDGLGGKADHFRVCVALSRHAEVARATRPRAGFKIDELVRLLESDFSPRTASSGSPSD